MELDKLKSMQIHEGNIVEFYVPFIEEPIILRYYRKIVEHIAKQDHNEHEKPPLLEVGKSREKHGVVSGIEEYSIDDIKWIIDKGKSSVYDVHTF